MNGKDVAWGEKDQSIDPVFTQSQGAIRGDGSRLQLRIDCKRRSG